MDGSFVQFAVSKVPDDYVSVAYSYPSSRQSFLVQQFVDRDEPDSVKDLIDGRSSDGYRVFRAGAITYWQPQAPILVEFASAGAVFVTGATDDGHPVVCVVLAPPGATVIDVRRLIGELS
jgi:hypothetical protein